MFKIGDEHELIKTVQTSLKKIGIECGPIDGIYGPKVDGAIEEFIKKHIINGDVITYDMFARILKVASDHKDVDKEQSDTSEVFSIERLDEISNIDCIAGYDYRDGGTSSEYWKRYCGPWVKNTKSYSKRYYPACAMGVHLWLKLSGLELPYFYKGTSLALVGGFKKWGQDKGLYEVDRWSSKIPAFSLIIFKGTSHIGITYKVCNPNDKTVYTREVNRKRRVVQGTRKRTSIQGFIPLESL